MDFSRVQTPQQQQQQPSQLQLRQPTPQRLRPPKQVLWLQHLQFRGAKPFNIIRPLTWWWNRWYRRTQALLHYPKRNVRFSVKTLRCPNFFTFLYLVLHFFLESAKQNQQARAANRKKYNKKEYLSSLSSNQVLSLGYNQLQRFISSYPLLVLEKVCPFGVCCSWISVFRSCF